MYDVSLSQGAAEVCALGVLLVGNAIKIIIGDKLIRTNHEVSDPQCYGNNIIWSLQLNESVKFKYVTSI